MGYISIADRRSQNFGFHIIAGSQKIEYGFIFCDRLQDQSQDRKQSQMIAQRSQKIEHGAIVCDHDRRIAEMEICSLRNEKL